MSYSHWFILSVLIVSLLSGCGGGGSGNNPGGGGAFSLAPAPTLIDAIARAVPTPGSVTQGSNVSQGVTTDRVSIEFGSKNAAHEAENAAHEDWIPYHPIATIDTGRPGERRILKSNDNPNLLEVHLPSGKIVHVNRGPDGFFDYSDPVFEQYDSHAEFPQNVYNLTGKTYYSEEFEARYGIENGAYSYPTDQQAEFKKAQNEISLENYFRHPKQNRRIDGLLIFDMLDGGSFGENEDGSNKVIGTPRGMSVFGFTDYPSSRESADSDYLSWGLWVYYEFKTTSDLDLSYGAFADGVATEFRDVPVTGTASYSGYSSGMAIQENAQSNFEDYEKTSFEFIAEVDLTADLSTASPSISGTVDNFKGSQWYNTSPGIRQEALGNQGFLQELTITLDEAAITERSSHSFFEGTARAATGLAGAEGKWGGQFFGTPGAGEAPPAVGGTWGVTQGTGPNDWKMIGGYGAWKGP